MKLQTGFANETAGTDSIFDSELCMLGQKLVGKGPSPANTSLEENIETWFWKTTQNPPLCANYLNLKSSVTLLTGFNFPEGCMGQSHWERCLCKKKKAGRIRRGIYFSFSLPLFCWLSASDLHPNYALQNLPGVADYCTASLQTAPMKEHQSHTGPSKHKGCQGRHQLNFTPVCWECCGLPGRVGSGSTDWVSFRWN